MNHTKLFAAETGSKRFWLLSRSNSTPDPSGLLDNREAREETVSGAFLEARSSRKTARNDSNRNLDVFRKVSREFSRP